MKIPSIPLLFVIMVTQSSTTAQPRLEYATEYTLSMPHPSNHLLKVAVTVHEPKGTTLDLHMAAWRTGRYVIQDFSGGVQEFSVVNEKGEPLPWEKTDKDTWRIERNQARSITASYNVYANEFNQRTRELNGEHAFLDPAAVFMYTDDGKKKPLRLTIVPYADWHVTTGLDEIPSGKNIFTAPNFEYFADCPIEIGNQRDFEFTAGGKRHIISIYGDGNWNSDTLIRDFRAIVEENLKFWGALPYSKYVFQIHCQPNAGGGTEHINSTIMGVRPFIFSSPGSYKGFLGLVSHEYFHTWNVKQLRPRAFAPYDFSKENYSKELWISEGMTSYFDDLILVRAGIRDDESFLGVIALWIGADRSRYGNTIQPLSEASFDAWVKYWRRRQNAEIAESDYYAKGQHVSLLLDLEIRRRSGNTSSLENVMKKMFEKYPSSKGFTNDEFIAECENASGGSLATFFNNYLFGTAPLAWEEHLTHAGLEVVLKDSSTKPGIGITINASGDRALVASVTPGTPANAAGIEVNDEIIAVDSFRVRNADAADRIAGRTPGESVSLTLFRNDKLKQLSVSVTEFPSHSYTVKKRRDPAALDKTIYEDWLKRKF